MNNEPNMNKNYTFQFLGMILIALLVVAVIVNYVVMK